MKRMQVLVNVTVPDDVSDREIRDYIKSAVSYWGGQYHPSDSLFSANIGKVTTKLFGKEGNHGKKNS